MGLKTSNTDDTSCDGEESGSSWLERILLWVCGGELAAEEELCLSPAEVFLLRCLTLMRLISIAGS